MVAQITLEGEKYVTTSLVPSIVHKIQSRMVNIFNDINTSETIRFIAEKMLTTFNLHWGSGADGTFFTENENEGPRRRQKRVTSQGFTYSSIGSSNQRLQRDRARRSAVSVLGIRAADA